MADEVKAWYFSYPNKRLRFGDGREIKLGITHKVKGPIRLCCHGLHGARRILDALTYAPGSIVWRVNLSGDIIRGTDKIVASERTYIAGGIDISDILYKFARMCALDVIHLWDAPDVVVRWLKTGDESLRGATQDVAQAAVRSATGAAACAAANAVWAASYVAADAATETAEAAARAAGHAVWVVKKDSLDATRDGYIARKEKQLYDLVMSKIG